MDKTKYENKMLVINDSSVPIHGLQPGKFKEIKVDKKGTPIDLIWRRRKKDVELKGDKNLKFEKPKVEKPEKKKEIK